MTVNLAEFCTALGLEVEQRSCFVFLPSPFLLAPPPERVPPPSLILPMNPSHLERLMLSGPHLMSPYPAAADTQLPPPIKVVPQVAYTRVLLWEVRVEVHIPLGDPHISS